MRSPSRFSQAELHRLSLAVQLRIDTWQKQVQTTDYEGHLKELDFWVDLMRRVNQVAEHQSAELRRLRACARPPTPPPDEG